MSQSMTEVLVQPGAERTSDVEAGLGNQALRNQLCQIDARLANLDESSGSVPSPRRSKAYGRSVSFLPGAGELSTNRARPSLAEPLLAEARRSVTSVPSIASQITTELKLEVPKPKVATYLVSNEKIKANTTGLAARTWKSMDDWAKSGTVFNWESTVEGVNEGDGWVRLANKAEELFLPTSVDGKRVLVKMSAAEPDERVYIVDNTQLCANTHGLAYRKSKCMDDKDLQDENVAPWGARVIGIAEGSDWIRVDTHFLPVCAHGIRVLTEANESEQVKARNFTASPTPASAEHTHPFWFIVLGGVVEFLCICTVMGFWVNGILVATGSHENKCGNAVIAFWILLAGTLILMTCFGIWGVAGHARGVIVSCAMAVTYAVVGAIFSFYSSVVPETCNTGLASTLKLLGAVHLVLALVIAIGGAILHHIHMADAETAPLAHQAKMNRHVFPMANAISKMPSIAEVTESLKRDHALFWANWRLAFAAAFWMSLFAAPICWDPVYRFLFGSSATVTVQGQQVPICDFGAAGRNVNTAMPGDVPNLRKWAEDDPLPWNPDDPSMVECGLLFTNYLFCWPTAIQMLVYTIYLNTGSTMRLAWHGICGTFLAILNMWVMKMILPHGAKGHICSADEADQGLCQAGGLLYDDPNYGTRGMWLCWFDVVFVLFLFLFSKAPENLIKFGMSYHICFMMSFMDHSTGASRGKFPTAIHGLEWDSDYTATLLTVVFGCMLSVFITYMPIPLLNINNLDRDAILVVHSIKDIWRLSITYFCGPEQTEMDQRIKARILTLDDPFNLFSGHVDDAWWEIFDIGHFGTKRALYDMFRQYINRFHTVMSALQTTIETVRFGEHHRCMCNCVMQEAMEKLNDATAETMEQCLEYCKAGHIDKDDKKNLETSIAKVEAMQAGLKRTYNDIMASIAGDRFVVRHLSQEHMFCFTLSSWARRCVRFAEAALKAVDDGVHHSHSKKIERSGSVCNSFKEAFSWHEMTKPEHLKFCFRNLASIVLCFVMGYFLPGNLKGTVFTPCSPAMANALALLINSKQGAAIKKSIERLLSVTLGKVLPILAMTIVGIIPPDHILRPTFHTVIIFIYMFMFEYMYFTSSNWSAIGCNVAAFGATFLYARQSDLKALVAFDARYQEIAQVIVAVLVQHLVDLAFKEESGRVHALRAVELFTTKFRKCLDDFRQDDSPPNIEDLHSHVESLHTVLMKAESWIPEVDPSMQFVSSWKAPFRHRLYGAAVHSFRHLIGDLRVMLLAMSDKSGGTESVKILRSLQSFDQVYKEFVNTFDDVMWLLQLILSQEDDRPIEDPRALQMETWRRDKELDGLDTLVEEINQKLNQLISSEGEASEHEFLCDDVRVRFSVLVRTLQNGRMHLIKLLTNCLQENIYAD